MGEISYREVAPVGGGIRHDSEAEFAAAEIATKILHGGERFRHVPREIRPFLRARRTFFARDPRGAEIFRA